MGKPQSKGTVLITGAGHRLGAAAAKHLLENGFSIIAHYRSNRYELEEFLRANEKYTSLVQWWCADLLTDTASAEKLPWSDITALINCAAVFERGSLFDSSWRDQLELNCFVPLTLSQIYSRLGTGGTIINVIDSNIQRVNKNFQNYRISKLFLAEITRQTAVTIGPRFRVNGIAPGTILPPESGADESYESAQSRALTAHKPSVETFLSALMFLLENSAVTGEIISVDGGVHAL